MPDDNRRGSWIAVFTGSAMFMCTIFLVVHTMGARSLDQAVIGAVLSVATGVFGTMILLSAQRGDDPPRSED